MTTKTTNLNAQKGANTMTTTTTENKPKNVKPANGTAPEKTAAPVEGQETEAKRRGVVPTMPMAIVYKADNRVHAVIHHPIDGTSYAESGKGEGSAKGALEDSGFRLSSLSLDGPEWLAEKLPAGAVLIGYASLKSFPLPTK